MENSIEKSSERILAKVEVLEAIARYTENAVLVRELSDVDGLYLLEVKIEGREPGKSIQYEYMRRGRFPNHNQASETAIYMVHYQGEMPIGGEKIAVYDPETDSWQKA